MSRHFDGIVIATLVALASTDVRAQSARDPVRILVVHGHNITAPGVVVFGDQLRAVVQAEISERVEFYEESLDMERFDDPRRSPQLARYFAEKYQDRKLNAVVAAGATALKFTTEHLGSQFRGVPIVYGLAFEPVLDFDALPSNVTGILQPLPIDSTFVLARSLNPQADRVVLVAGASARDTVVAAAAVKQLAAVLGGMKLDVLQNWTYNSLLDSLRRMTPRTIVILSAFRRDQSGYEFNSADIIPSIARAASVPLFGIARNWVGDGIVGGAVMDFRSDGTRTGQLLVRVLKRAPGEPMPQREVAGVPFVVDWRQLQRWSLREDQLPPSTEVIYRTPTLWQRHWPSILTVLTLLAAQSILIWRLLLERSRRRRAQSSVAEQMAYEQMLSALSADAVRAASAEEPRALEDALARIGRFADAQAAALIINAGPRHSPIRVFWSATEGSTLESSYDVAQIMMAGGSHLKVHLTAESQEYGVLELYGPPGHPWRPNLVSRVEAAADLIASALARERAGRALEQTRTQIAHMARVATVGEMAAAVSHDLRQPLTAIRINAEAGAFILAQEAPEVDAAREILQDIRSDGLRAAEIIDHIGLLVKKQEPTSSVVELNGVCRHSAHLLERDVRLRGAQLKLELDPELRPVNGDPVQLQQIVINLVINALDAASASPGCEITIGTMARDGLSEIYVQDGGPGLPEDLLDQVFEPFFSTKPQGLGMGLAIVRTITERHRGTVRAANGAGGGAIFSVAFPALEASSNSRLEGDGLHRPRVASPTRFSTALPAD